MHTEHGPYEFGPRGSDHTAETQTPHPTQSPGQPDDARAFGPLEQEALLKRDQLHTEMIRQDVEPQLRHEAMRRAMRDVHEARRQDEQAGKEHRADAARADIAAAYTQRQQPVEQPETPYPVRTTMGQRNVPVSMPEVPSSPQGQSDLQGDSLRTHVKHLLGRQS